MGKTNIYLTLIFNIGTLVILIEVILEQIKFNNMYKCIEKQDILLKLKLDIRKIVIYVVAVIALIILQYWMIRKERNITLKVLFEYNIIAYNMLVCIIGIVILSRTFFTDKCIVMIGPIRIITNMILWNEVTKYSVNNESITIEYKRKNKYKKVEITVKNNEEKIKVVSIIENNMKSTV